MEGKRDPAATPAETEPGTTLKLGGAPKTEPMTTPVEVAHVVDKYRIDDELGAGGMGAVYAAFDSDLERHVALKVLHEPNSGRESRERLLREARAMARLSHPNVVRVYEVGAVDGRDFVAMELIEGTTLADWVRSGPRAPEQIIAAFVAAGRGLAAAHAARIVHRDFKPHNVLRRKDGLIAVTDFGIARDVVGPLDTTLETTASSRDTPSPLSGLTEAGSVVGTPAYMAPEQWLGEPVGPAADQFAFCVALWEALVGSRPFKGAVDEMRARILRGPHELDASKLPREVRAAILRGLEPDPNNRWPSMEVLLDTLERSQSRVAFPIALGAAVILAIAAIVWVITRQAPAWKPVIHKLEPAYDENGSTPAISPDGKQLAFVSDRLDPQKSFSAFVMPIEGGPATRIDTPTLTTIDNVRWSRDGKALLLLRAGQLIRHPLDGSAGETIVDGVEDFEDCGDVLALASPGTGELLLVQRDNTMNVLVSGDTRIQRPRCIPGGQIVYVRVNVLDRGSMPVDGALGDLWIVDRQGHTERLTSDGASTDPSFTPDGKSIVFARNDRDGTHLYERILGSGALHQLTFDVGPDIGPSVSPDGRTLVFNRDTTSSEIHVGVLGGKSARVITPRHMFGGLWPTRDGRRLVGKRFDLDGSHVIVIDVETGHQTDLGLGEGAFLSADDRHVYFHPAAQPNTLYSIGLDGGSPELVATFPMAIVDGVATADGPHVLLRTSDGVGVGWSVANKRAVDEHAAGLVIPAPSGPWRAVVVVDHVELSAPGQPVRTLACDTGFGWLDDHRFACATESNQVTTLDVITDHTEQSVTTSAMIEDARIVNTPQGIRWAATVTHGQVTRFAITNFDERPWKP